ncbi:MAG: AMP-binding protein, partial [Alloalcanivorax xenomutans]
MRQYNEAVDQFDIQQVAKATLGGSLESLNACVECCDRHALPGRIALFWEGADGDSATYTFSELRDQASRFAAFLANQGVGAGDCVAGLLPRRVELLITVLATWRLGAVYQPLFTAFGPKAIDHRLQTAGTRVVVTDGDNRGKLDGLESDPLVVTVGGDKGRGIRRGDFSFWAELESQQDGAEPVMRSADDPFLMMFTSGTTGLPKAVPVPLKAIVAFAGYMQPAVGLREDDAFWKLADPGWAYGLYYAVTGPLSVGHPTTFYDGGFTVESTCRVINKYGITNLAGSPTAYRLLMAGGDTVVKALRGKLRAVSSAGEPLTPEVIRWFAKELGTTIHDHYGQTELGMVLCNHHELEHPVRIGAAGFAVPGHRVVVVNEEGEELPAGQPGILAVDRNQSPLFWFPGYPADPQKSMLKHYYMSGDTVELNDDGSISFVGRS